jgi:hypothetical protein
MTLLMMALAAVGAALAGWAWLPRGRNRPLDQVDAFTVARSVTNRWSADPESAPAPVRDYLAQQQRPTPE